MESNRTELARIFGVTTHTVDAWRSRGCPVREPGNGPRRGNPVLFWTPAVVEWWLKHELAPREGPPAATDDLAELSRRIAAAAAAEAEIKLGHTRGELALVSEWGDQLASVFARVGARLKTSAPKHAVEALGVQSLDEGLERHRPVIQTILNEFHVESTESDWGDSALADLDEELP